MIEYRCVSCQNVFPAAAGFYCPECGSKLRPMDISEDVMLNMNWTELLLLFRWAESWAMQAKVDEQDVEAFYAIAERVSQQRPEGAKPLFFVEEIMENMSTSQIRIPHGLVSTDGTKVYPIASLIPDVQD